MNFALIFEIAKSLLLARWKQTLVAAVGVTFGISMFIAMQSFMTGLNELLDGLMLNRTPHIRLFNEIRPNRSQPLDMSMRYSANYHFIASLKAGSARLPIYNCDFIIKDLKAQPGVFGCTPRVTAQVLFNYGTLDLNAVISGIDALEESRLFAFPDYIVQGDVADVANVSNSVVLGISLANKMQAEIGDIVTITSGEGQSHPLKVVALFQSGINDIDNVQCYASLKTTQKILGRPGNYITDIYIKLKDLNLAPLAAREYASLYNTTAEDIQTANAQYETGSRVRSIISYSVGITLLIVAGFGIYNILNMLIYEKMDSIAILKAMGFSGKDVKAIFLGISLVIGISGGLAGLIAGFLISLGISHIPFNTTALPTIKTYPVNFDPWFYVIGLTFSIITTYLAGLFPAVKAQKIDPVVIIRAK